MKKIRLIRSFFNRSWFSALFVVIIALLALVSVISSSAYFIDMSYSYRVLETCKLKNAYYCACSLTPADLESSAPRLIQTRISELINQLQNNPCIEHVYIQRTASYVSYNDLLFGIVLYEPGFIEAFPMLKKYGIDFSKDPDGVILSNNYFGNVKTGESIDVDFVYGESQYHSKLISAGLMKYPYKYIGLTGAGSVLYASHMIMNSPVLIMQATEKNLDMLQKYTNITYPGGLVFTTKNDTPEETLELLLKDIRSRFVVDSFENIICRSRETTISDAKKGLIRPVFLMLSAVLSYVSVVIMMVIKKQKDMAVLYLCGAKKKDIVNMLLLACAVISAVPAIICTGFILTASLWQYKWKEIPMVSSSVIINDQIWIVVAFFVLTVIVSFAAALISMGRKSPLAYLRGLE